MSTSSIPLELRYRMLPMNSNADVASFCNLYGDLKDFPTSKLIICRQRSRS